MIGKLLASQLEYTAFSFEKNLEGITHDDSLAQPRPNGNCINWVVGHIVHHRNIMHRLAGLDPVWTSEREERYYRASKPMTSPANAENLSELRAMYEASHSALSARLQEMTAEEMEREIDGKSLATLLAGLVFHESYHMGQIGVIRRVIGKQGVLT